MKTRCLLALSLFWTLTAFARPAIFLIPGSGSSGGNLWFNGMGGNLPALLGMKLYFGKFQAILTEEGIPNFICPNLEDHDQSTLEQRSNVCVNQILKYENLKQCDARSPREIVLFGHSMGGLVGRLVAQDPRVKDCIRSVTSISTPHQGTPFADLIVDHVDADETHFDLIAKILGMTGYVPSNLHYLPELFASRTNRNPSLFHAQDIGDNPAVQYFSFTDSMPFIPVLPLELGREWMTFYLQAKGLDQTSYGSANDGVVPEYSMVHGTNLGHIDAYHWATSCEDTAKNSVECTRTIVQIMPHLVMQSQ